MSRCREDEGWHEPHSAKHPEQTKKDGDGVSVLSIVGLLFTILGRKLSSPPWRHSLSNPGALAMSVWVAPVTLSTANHDGCIKNNWLSSSICSYSEELSRCQEEVRRLQGSLAAARDDCVSVSDERLQLQQENLQLRREMDEVRKATLLVQKKAKQQVTYPKPSVCNSCHPPLALRVNPITPIMQLSNFSTICETIPTFIFLNSLPSICNSSSLCGINLLYLSSSR